VHPSRRSKPELRRWFSEAGDIRADKTIRAEILVYLKQHSVHSVAVADRIIASASGLVGLVPRPTSHIDEFVG